MFKVTSNIDSVLSKWVNIANKLPRIVTSDLGNIGGLLVNKVRSNLDAGIYGVKTDTGALRNSIRYTMSGATLGVGSDLVYAQYQEEGTKYLRATHFIRRSIEEDNNTWKQAFIDYLIRRVQ